MRRLLRPSLARIRSHEDVSESPVRCGPELRRRRPRAAYRCARRDGNSPPSRGDGQRCLQVRAAGRPIHTTAPLSHVASALRDPLRVSRETSKAWAQPGGSRVSRPRRSAIHVPPGSERCWRGAHRLSSGLRRPRATRNGERRGGPRVCSGCASASRCCSTAAVPSEPRAAPGPPSHLPASRVSRETQVHDGRGRVLELRAASLVLQCHAMAALGAPARRRLPAFVTPRRLRFT